MKNWLFLCLCLCGLCAAPAAADDKILPTADMLPERAMQFIQDHFPGKEIAVTRMEDNVVSKSYEVIFEDGCKVEFTRKGAWKEVDCKRSEVPSSIIPLPIREYVTKKYPQAKIIEIERDSLTPRKYYEVKLSNGWELTFNKKFELTGMDN